MISATGIEGIAIWGWLVWILPFIGAAIIPLVSKKGNRIRDYTAVAFALMSALSAASLLSITFAGDEVHSQISWISSLGINAGVLLDPMSVIMTNLVAWISFLIIVYSVGYLHGDRDLARYWFFMLFFIGSMQLIVLSDNLLMVFFGWEGVGLASYALIGYWYRDRKQDYVGKEGHYAGKIAMWASPTHAGIKAFLQTRAADTMMLAGMFLIFMHSGTFGFKELVDNQAWAETMAQNNLLIPAAILLFGGAIGKSAQFPFNEWLLEAMTGPTSVSALIHAATMVKAGVFFVARIAPLFFALDALDTEAFFIVIAWVGGITAFLLASQALVNPEIKKVLAYSTGSQIGYMMMALGIAGVSTNFADGYTAGFFHMMSHAMFKASLFMGAGAVLHAIGSRFMTDMGGLRKDMRKTFIFMSLSALSLAGAPLVTSGFWSKDAVFASLLESNNPTGIALFGLAFAVAIMTAFYTFRMIGMVFFGNKSKYIQELEDKNHHIHEAPNIMWIPFAILAVATIAIGVVGFLFEEQIHTVLSNYLLKSFGIGHENETTGHGSTEDNDGGLNPIAVAASVIAFGVGGGLGYLFYIARKFDPNIISKSPILSKIWSFLYNRWYLNSLLYWGSVEIPLRIYRIIWTYFENIVMEGINPLLQHTVSGLSRVVKSAQTGLTQIYLFVFAVGIMIMLLLMYLF